MMNVIKNKKIILLSTIAICLLIACIVLGATIKSYKKNNKETVKETSKPTTTQTEKATTQDKTISDNDKVKEEETTKANEKSKLSVSYSVSNEWQNGDVYYKQYDFAVSNASNNEEEGWQLVIDVYDDTIVDSAWNCNAKIEGNKLYIDGKGFFSEKISADQTVSDMGVIISSKASLPIHDIVISDSSKGNETETIKETQTDAANNSTTEATTQSSTSSTTQAPTASQTNTPNKEANYNPTGTAVANHGALRVSGTDLVDMYGNPYRLCGVSTHGISWFPQYVDKDGFKTLRDDWGVNVIRLVMYPREYNGYLTGGNQSELIACIDKGVKYATELGMYVIIDWHVLNYNPNEIQSEAVTFFKEMSSKYSSYNNVIYEICNEPVGAPWSSIRSYANTVVATIRENDKDAIILVGTNTWSQDVDEVIGNRVDNDSNVMYVSHFYAATHKEWIRNKIIAARNAGIPVFVSECSICDASGNGGIDYTSANEWFDFFANNNMSYITWSLCNKAETSALISSSCNKTSGFSVSDLSEAGKWFRDRIRKDMGK